MTGASVHGLGQALAGPARRVRVAVLPGSGLRTHAELWRALEEAFPVGFVGDADVAGADAAVVFPGAREQEPPNLPRLVLQAPNPVSRSPFIVEMARSERLDRTLQGQCLLEEAGAPPATVPVGRSGRVLATVNGLPIWAELIGPGVDREVASAIPMELGEHEFLRDHLTAGRFWSLLPLVHFLKRIAGGNSAQPRSHDACFMIDDPNPRLPSYGHVRFAELARDAQECGYHVAVATIPLDLVLPGRRATRVFRRHREQLSLVVHGNDHLRRELERPRSADEADRLVGTAATRVARFERRAGIRVERVMCPPHDACGARTLGSLFRFGFLGLAASRPFPWDSFAEHRSWRLGNWLPAQFAGGGLPVVSRYLVTRNLDDLVFRAFLDQPLVLHCHHADLAGSFAPLREAVARVNQFGDVRWRSLAAILDRNAVVSEGHSSATVTVCSRRLRISRPRGAVLRVAVPRIYNGPDPLRLLVDGRRYDVRADRAGRFALTVPAGEASDDLRIGICGHGDARESRHWRPRPWPLARRILTESRDRAHPLLDVLRW